MRDVCDSLMDIINAIDAAQAFVQNMDEATFAADQRTQYAITYALMIVGEAAKQIPGPIRSRYSAVRGD